MGLLLDLLFGERSLTKVAGVFDNRAGADAAATRLRQATGLDASQIRVLHPEDGRRDRRTLLAREVEPERHGIWRTIVRAHVVMGILGLLAGLVVHMLLLRADNPAVESTPLLSLVPMAGFGITFGLLLGGLIALRPDHARLITRVRAALDAGKWAVVAHPLDRAQTQRVIEAFGRQTDTVVRSF